MDLRLTYLYRNLTRNPLRTLLTCAAVAMPITIYVLSEAVILGLDRFLDNAATQLRLVVIHRGSIVNPLPIGYLAKIRSLDPTHARIVSICGMRWLGGRIENNSHPLSTLAAQSDTLPAAFPDQQLTADEIDAWNRDRQAIIVGSATARQFGWKTGDRITIWPSVPPYSPIPFHVVSTSPLANDPITNFCRLDYLEETLKSMFPLEGWAAEEWVSFIFVKCATQADLDHFRVAIDELFARSPDETKTQDEKAFMSDFIAQFFNLPRNLRILSAVTVFVAVMAGANTMSMNLRDRSNETAVLKSLGFSGVIVSALIQTESLVLCAIGGVVGAAVPYVAFTHTPLRNYPVPLIQHLEIQSEVCAESLLVALAVGLLAAAWPSWAAWRMPVITSLRTLE